MSTLPATTDDRLIWDTWLSIYRLPIMTVADPFMMVSGGPAQVSMSPMVAAGKPPIRTVVVPGGRIGPPTWGTSPVTIGQTCISVMRAAGWPMG